MDAIAHLLPELEVAHHASGFEAACSSGWKDSLELYWMEDSDGDTVAATPAAWAAAGLPVEDRGRGPGAFESPTISGAWDAVGRLRPKRTYGTLRFVLHSTLR